MRDLLYTDLDRAVRVLMDLPRSARLLRARRMLVMADIADRHRQETGRPHQWGNGSLHQVAQQWHAVGSRPFDDEDCRECWQIMLAAISAHKRNTAVVDEMVRAAE